jgi:hypothetical protein
VQATCLQCGQKITIDDAKVPDRPFAVKCPKCQTVVKVAGRAAPVPETVEAPPPSVETEEVRTQMMAQIRREMSTGEGAPSGRALVLLSDRALSGAITLALTRLGHPVDSLEDSVEAIRLLEQGLYAIVVTSRTPPQAGKGESLHQRLSRLNPEARRGIFLVLVGAELKTGDGTQAFALLADLVVNPKDATGIDTLLRSTLGERQRLYQTFLDVRRRHETMA